MSLRDALDSWPEPEGSFDEVLEQSAQRVFHDGAAHPVEPAPVASRERVEKALRGKPIIRSADKPEGWRGGLSPEEIADITDALLAAGVFREPPTVDRDDVEILVTAATLDGQKGDLDSVDRRVDAVLALIGGQPECGAVDRSGQRRCVFTPGHHEVENWTSHADRGGWTWNDQPADVRP